MATEEAGFSQDLIKPLLEDWESFRAVMLLALSEDPLLAEDFRETEALFSAMCGGKGEDDGTTLVQSASPDEEERLINAIYNCIQTDSQFREGLLSGIERRGVSAETMAPLLENYDSFLTIMLIVLQEDPSLLAELLEMEAILSVFCGSE